MARLNFEKNLQHQSLAVKSVVKVFDGVELIKHRGIDKEFCNPVLDIKSFEYQRNIRKIQEKNNIKESATYSNIIDIMMETGTGKTYTYTKTIFELNKLYGIFKFIIVVPTLSIKAGTVNFLKSKSAIEHFREQYSKSIELHIVENKKSKKSKKSYMPQAISSFVNAGNFEKDKIQVLIINAGMINSKTMSESFDKNLLDRFHTPFEALSATKSFMIIDEPHKFSTTKTTWKNIQNINPQIILRYGATFPTKEIKVKNYLGKTEKKEVKDYHNLVYKLSAVDAFNQNLVKGVIGHITEFESAKNLLVKFVNSDGKEASFELIDNKTKKSFKLAKKDSLEKIHSAMSGLYIENLNKTTVLLSNGLELKKGDKINPYSYAQTLQETMIKKAIKHHFEIERKYLTQQIKIKPLTLFFIDNIEEYRQKGGYIRKTLESYIKAEIEKLLKEEKDNFYKEFLEKSLKDLSKTHGGYFSKDNSEKDEAIEKEVNEILHDKEALLDLKNVRRFIFSKWTLREGWDNPNIFQICKLRSSGSEISKLQEVGRGLRLPVNEYGNRVKDDEFFLNYFVDFTENDFVDKLVNEINEKSEAISIEKVPEKLKENMIKKICEIYNFDEEELLEKLDDENVIKRNNAFKENGFEYIKSHFPLIFDGVNSNKIKKATQKTKKVKIRTEKYSELKALWEKLNEKVVLEYKVDNENEMKKLFLDFLTNYTPFKSEGITQKLSKVDIENNKAIVVEESSSYNDVKTISTMKYSDFLKELSASLNINIKTLHQSFVESKIDINNYLNQTTLRLLKQKFDDYLLYNALGKFKIEYKKVSSQIHPTKFTDRNGEVKDEINASDIGLFYSNEKVANSYFLDELFYDSELEKENIKANIKEVVVFTKIPKNSIKIPIAGGKSYSPDFAYVLNFKDGEKKLYFIVETKNSDEDSLREEEKQKIEHAKKLFGNTIDIKFKTQFKEDEIIKLIRKIQEM